MFKRLNCIDEETETFYRDIYLISPLEEPSNSSIKIFEVSQQRFIPKQRDFQTRSTAAGSSIRFTSNFRFSSIPQRLTSFAKDVKLLESVP